MLLLHGVYSTRTFISIRTNYLNHFVQKILDADKGERLESSTGRVASRDIVQFVPLRDVQSKSLSHKPTFNKSFDDHLSGSRQ